MIYRVKRGPVLLWTVTTTVQRTNERVLGITGANPVTVADYYQAAVFEVACTAQTNLTLTSVTIFASFTAGGINPAGVNANAFCLPVSGTVPALVAGTGAVAAGTVRLNNLVTGGGGVMIVPPVLTLEYTTAAPGATPVLTFEVRAVFEGGPFFGIDP